jgi:hypothetical protein
LYPDTKAKVIIKNSKGISGAVSRSANAVIPPAIKSSFKKSTFLEFRK